MAHLWNGICRFKCRPALDLSLIAFGFGERLQSTTHHLYACVLIEFAKETRAHQSIR